MGPACAEGRGGKRTRQRGTWASDAGQVPGQVLGGSQPSTSTWSGVRMWETTRGGGGGRGRGAPWEGRMHAGRVCSAEVWPGCRQARPLCLSLSRSRGRSGRPGGLTRPELSAHRGSCLHEDEAGPGELALREPSESGVCGAVAEVGCRRKPVCPVMCACGRSCVHRFLSR